jgi:hypothetical protein
MLFATMRAARKFKPGVREKPAEGKSPGGRKRQSLESASEERRLIESH